MNKSIGATSWRTWFLFGAAAVLLGCGEVGGGGQCFDVDTSGACITIDTITPTYNGADTDSVDVTQNLDCNNDGTFDDAEFFGSHSARVGISVNLMPGVASSKDGGPAPDFVTFTGYTVQYTPSPTNLVAAPVLTTQAFTPSSWKINSDGTSVETTLEFVITQTKEEYFNNGGSLVPKGSYAATYTITGTTQFFQDVVLTGSTNFEIGGFDYCS